jgi:hypothetical protein
MSLEHNDLITWEQDHPITHALIQALGRDLVRMSKNQMGKITSIVGKMETDLYHSVQAQIKLRNHIIWHIEKNGIKPAYKK